MPWLRNAQSVISDRLKKGSLLTQRKLYKLLTETKAIKREIKVEQDVPDIIENTAALMRYL